MSDEIEVTGAAAPEAGLDEFAVNRRVYEMAGGGDLRARHAVRQGAFG